ncbi:bacterial bifunctional deaminase-reductase [Rhodofomes roseus]|uniref:2,5-diamino-6-ribosylamino-4(3H)-pyrimidinone 5'-phosphate reductase n=1 Tax=Rhodofomes roseus TaxID=34475 RepID=A0ABQ8KHD4_9APHY|nr:bacterial bifunctional deaminase-reductase [Rhodofomes roseus]KAH9837275.1 bacterial bifunctional deaminase-reductase [Rhodofomes roseus]
MLEMATSPPGFLRRVYDIPTDSSETIYTGDERKQGCLLSPDQGRPYVTLTFAQSLDAKIAGMGGKQLALSGKESMLMTHWMRTLHDGILVGIGTALNDNPQLNTRHLPPFPAGFSHRYHLPRPIILDTHLSLSVDCKLLTNFKAGVGRRPWIVASLSSNGSDELRASRRSSLEAAGARIVEVGTSADGRIPIPALLVKLRGLGMQSLMVEGGARVIQCFLAAEAQHRNCIDTVIVTIAPTIVGKDGVAYGSNLPSDTLPAMQHVETELFGRDAVVALRIHQRYL